MTIAGHALHQQSHLFVLVQNPALLPVRQGLIADRARVDPAHRGEELLQAFRTAALHRAEHALVFAGEGVAEVVLQQTGGPDDDRRGSEIVQHVRKAVQDVLREASVEHSLPDVLVVGQNAVGVLLPLPVPPAVVDHQEGVVHVGTHEEGVVRFEDPGPAAVTAPQDRVCQQHPYRFAPDVSGADHPFPDRHHVAQRQVFPREFQNSFLPRHDQFEKLLLLFRRRSLRCAPRLHFPQAGLGIKERAVPDTHHAVARAAETRPRSGVQDRDDVGACGHRFEAGVVGPAEQRERRGCIAPVQLHRLDEDRPVVAKHVHQDLRRFGDRLNGVVGMKKALQGEVGHTLGAKDERTGELKEVADHAVGVVALAEVRERVEEQHPPVSVADDVAVHGGDKVLKAVVQRKDHLVDLPLLHLGDGEESRVLGKAEVYQLRGGRFRLRRRCCRAGQCPAEQPVLIEVVHPPDDVVAGAQAIQ